MANKNNKPSNKPSSASSNNNNNRGKKQNYSNRNRNNRRYSDRDPRECSSTADERRTGGNHVSWYVPDPNQLANVASIPFNYRVGDMMQTYTSNSTLSSFALAGVLSIGYYPVYGKMVGYTDPINVASTAVYSWIRHANSGSRNYDHVDLMLYLMAMDSIYSGITWFQRLISVLMNYNNLSIYTPRAVVNAMGVNYNGDLYGELPAIRSRLNNVILKATTLCVPSTFPLYARHAFMNSNIYLDEPNARGQYYVFNPTALWQFGRASDGAGRLTPVDWVAPNWSGDMIIGTSSWVTYMVKLEAMLDALYGDEDAGIMSGDILKAYGDGSLFKLVTLPDNTVLLPVYDPDMLDQIHNIDIVGRMIKSGTADIAITQVNSSQVYGPYLSSALFTFANDTLMEKRNVTMLDLHTEISPEAVMRATRLKYSSSDWPSEVVSHMSLFSNSQQGGVLVQYPITSNWISVDSGSLPDTNLDAVVGHLTTFSNAPLFYILFGHGESGAIAANDVYYPVGQIDKLTTITRNINISRLNEVALLGLFNVPRLTLGFIQNA